MIKIFQINSQKDKNNIMFMGYHVFKKYDIPFDFTIYDEVWEGVVPKDCTLKDIFKIFNIAHPSNYKGHSLSVSDIVEVIELNNVKSGFYYCDNFGWKKLEL